MKLTALLFLVALIFLPAQSRSQEWGHWELRLVGHHANGRPHYARVYCRADGRCYRRRPVITQRSGTRVYSYER
ncbi:MAG: hypothetical protein J2P51_15495, partial [Hyphomicrobiaceae bacterium]|nr:hypothetical protein [Hyphomicrobiaceae bacterium]